MRFSETRRAFERMADRGHIKDEHIDLLAHTALFEAAGHAFGRAYYGERLWGKAEDAVHQRRAAVEAAKDQVDNIIQRWEARAKHDIGQLPAALAREAIHTTLDLPAIIGQARDVTIRATEDVVTESALMNGAAKTSRVDFREHKSIRKDVDSLGLFLQPEGTNVRYESFSWTEDGYALAKYSRATGWTWEAKVADDATGFLAESAALGTAARLNRLQVLIAAIVAGTTRTTLTGGGAGAGGPSIANVEAARAALAALNRRLGTVSIPVSWEGLARATRDNQFIPASNPAELNPVYQAFTVNVEESDMFSEVLAAAASGNALDWLAHDANIASWLEFATLRGFEGGPAIVFKLPDVQGRTDLGSFDNMTDAMKVVDTAGAKVTDANRVMRIAGA